MTSLIDKEIDSLSETFADAVVDAIENFSDHWLNSDSIKFVNKNALHGRLPPSLRLQLIGFWSSGQWEVHFSGIDEESEAVCFEHSPLTQTTFRKNLRTLIESEQELWSSLKGDNADYDADDADIILQYLFFGEVIFS